MDVYKNDVNTQITLHLANQLPSAKVISYNDDFIEILVERTEEIQKFKRNTIAIVYRGPHRYEIDPIYIKPTDRLYELRTPH